jgi:hypothetical protein
MTYILGHDRSQILSLPEAVDDYVGPDNPVRFMDAFVDGLDLAAASFIRVEPKVTGRPGYAPAKHQGRDGAVSVFEGGASSEGASNEAQSIFFTGKSAS